MCSIFNLTKIITVSWAENNISPLTDVQSQNNKTSFFKLWATQHQSAKADGTLLFGRAMQDCRSRLAFDGKMTNWAKEWKSRTDDDHATGTCGEK